MSWKMVYAAGDLHRGRGGDACDGGHDHGGGEDHLVHMSLHWQFGYEEDHWPDWISPDQVSVNSTSFTAAVRVT
jgi:hypothetical protein